MLGSLARKLRMFGFDTTYEKMGSDKDLLRKARQQDRVLLTSDRSLAMVGTARAIAVILVEGDDDKSRISSLLATARNKGIELARGESRCAACNGGLLRATKPNLNGRVPDAVLRRHRLYFVCETCDKIYWKGSHWKRLRSLEQAFPAGKRI
jgi:uncharacterized protein with PIN domain